MEIITSDIVKPELRDCFNCIHTHGASCQAPAYRAMSHAEMKAFWKDPEPPCRLFEVDPSSLFLTFSPNSCEGVALQEEIFTSKYL